MKTTATVLAFIATMAFTGMAMATTWSVSNYPNVSLTSAGYSNTLDLSTVGFKLGDTIDSAVVTFDFAGLGIAELTQVTLNNLINTPDQQIILFGSKTFDVTSNLVNGTLSYTVKGVEELGTVNLIDATLSASGTEAPADAAAVPEPGTIILLGAGLLGLAFYSKRINIQLYRTQS